MRSVASFALIVSVVFAASCGSRELSVPAEDAYPPHFTALRDRIFKPRCATCHAKIVLYKEVAGDLVVAGKPEASLLFQEIDSGGMPKYGGKLTDEEIAAVKTWISNGAPND